ncbi:hypothetical protein EIP86_009759 [Pleurotus ostreatoroseus]|nr:hypothetical protein EIP86_009759 [Pleurotus ostreatoroseus]
MDPHLKKVADYLILNRSICLKWLDFGPRIEKPQLPEVEFIILNWALVLLSYIPRIFSRLLTLLTKRHIKEWQPPLTTKEVEINKALRTTSLEEKDIAADDQKDLELLSTVDSILSDDELLHTTMCTMVVRGQFKPVDVMAFVREVLVHRLPQVEEFLVPGLSSVVDLRKLPSRVWEVVVDLTCAALQVHPHQRKDGRSFLDVVPSSVYHDALAILLSRVNDPLVAELDSSILRSFAFSFTEMPQIAPGAFAHLPIREILVHLRRFFPAGEFKKPTLVSRLHRAVHCHSRCQHSSLSHQFLAHRDVFDEPNQLLDMVYQCLQESIDWEATPSEGLSELLCAIVVPDIFDNGDTRGVFTKRIFTSLSRAPPTFLGQLITTSFAENLLRLVTEVRMPFLLELLGSRKFLHILILALARYLDVAPVSDLVIRRMSRIISVLCMRTLRMFEAAIRPLAEEPGRLQNEEEWVALLHLLSEGVNSRYYEPVHDQHLHFYATDIGTKYSDLFAALLPEALLASITHISSATYPLDDGPQTNSARAATGLQDGCRLDSVISLSVLRSSKSATRAADAVDSIIRQFGVELRALEADWLWAKAQAWRGRCLKG